jgi:hypothetical protein
MSDYDAQRLIRIIDERIEQHLAAGLSYHHGVVASVSTSPQTCTVYLYGSTDTSGGFYWSGESFPQAGDTVRVAINRTTGDRWVDAVVSRPNLVMPSTPTFPFRGIDLLKSGTQSGIADSTWTKVTGYAVSDFDSGDLPFSGGDITLPWAGLYIVTATADWGTNTTGKRMLGIGTDTVSPAGTHHESAMPATQASILMRAAFLWYAASANTKVALYVWQNSGGAISLNTQSSLSVAFLGGLA